MAGKIIEESLAINNVGMDGYIRVVSNDGYSYRMPVQTFVDLCASAETIQNAVDAWLAEHPEATTTVEDGSITEVKLSADLQETLHTLIRAIGGPNAAATVSEMTDQNKIYVYTGSEEGYTAGNWYYYKEGAWVSGGVYNSTALETDPTLSVAGMAADAKATGDQITELIEDLDKLVEIPGDNIIALTDFAASTGTSVTVDDTDDSITVTTTSAGTYRCAQTAATFIPNNLEIGKTYRLHAKAEKVSGSPIVHVSVRGINGNADGTAKSIILDGEEGWFDFVVDEYMKKITLFVTWNTSASASVKFSEIWLKEYDTTGIDDVARDGVEKLQYNKADGIRQKVSGDTVSFTDGADNVPLTEARVQILAGQEGEGTPSTTNIRNIVGYTGCTVKKRGINQFDVEKLIGSYNVVINGNDLVGTNYTTSIYGLITNIRSAINGSGMLDWSNVEGGVGVVDIEFEHITFGAQSDRSDHASMYIKIWYTDGTSTSRVVTAESSGKAYHYSTRSSDEKSVQKLTIEYYQSRAVHIFDFMVVIHAEDYVYEGFRPYGNKDYAVTFPSEAGTIYGGYLDLVEKSFLCTHGIFALTSELLTNLESGYYGFDATRGAWIRNLLDSTMTHVGYWITSTSVPLFISNFAESVVVNNMNIASTQRRTSFKGNWTSWEEFVAAIADLEARGITPSFVAPIRTPVLYESLEIEEIASNYGENTFSCDEGVIDSIVYSADTELHYDNKFNQTKSIIAGVETSMTAMKNYSIGDMLIVGDNLYKVTSAIATGGAIKEGTNVTATTVAEQLIALANA